jgi:pimeloyl-ACP methyl ester carboxylesterase
MTHFVLVPGAWLGGWAWHQVTPMLREAGHDATAVTLSGVSDRSNVLADQVGQETHVADIVAVVESGDLRDVVLVGHSYSGRAANDGSWPAFTAEEFQGQDLPDEQVAMLVSRMTPHPGRSTSEPARLQGSIAELPATYIKCLMDGPEPNDEVKKLLEAAD